MKKEVISERQGIIFIILFILGSTFLVGTGGHAKQDAWLSIIIAISVSTIVFLMFSRILSLYPGKDLFDILQIVMGKFVGKIVSLLMIWFAFHLGTLVLRNLSEFTNTVVFPDTPVVLPMIFFILLLIWGIKEGIEVLGRWSEFFIWIVIILFIFYTLLSISQMDVSKLKPILNNGLTPILKGTFSTFSFPFGETVVFTMVFSNVAIVKNYNKIFILGLFIGGFIILISVTRNLLLIGSETLSRTYFPSYMAISLINIGALFQRLEMLVTIEFFVCIFIKICICLIAACNGISKVMGFDDYKFLATPVALLMLNLSFIIYKSTMEMASWAFNIWPYYSFVFEVILPFMVFIMVEIKSRIQKKI